MPQQSRILTRSLRSPIRLIGLFVLVMLPMTASAEEVEPSARWGDLRVSFLYDGMDYPKPELLPVGRDVAVMREFEIVDEQWVVDPKTLGVANVVMYMEDDDVPVHESYKKDAKATIPLALKRGRFDPHVICVRSSQSLEIRNADLVAYCAKADLLHNQPFNVLVPRGVANQQAFDGAERIPVRLTDNIHPWIRGWLLVRNSPYMACSSENGTIVIKNIPAGARTFRFWHEEAGFLSGLGKRGKVEIEIIPGEIREIKIRLRKDNSGTLVKSTTRPIEEAAER